MFDKLQIAKDVLEVKKYLENYDIEPLKTSSKKTFNEKNKVWGLHLAVIIQNRKGIGHVCKVLKVNQHWFTGCAKVMDFDYAAYEDNVIVCGAHWQGKTYFVSHAIIANLVKIANIWIYDYNGTITKYLNPKPHLIKRDIKELFYGVQFYIPTKKDKKEYQEFCGKALTHKNLVVVTDEAHNNSSPHRIEGNHAEIVRNAGNQGISYIEIFQRPQRVNGDVLENARHRFCFALDSMSSRKYMYEWIGIEIQLFISPENRTPSLRKQLQYRGKDIQC